MTPQEKWDAEAEAYDGIEARPSESEQGLTPQERWDAEAGAYDGIGPRPSEKPQSDTPRTDAVYDSIHGCGLVKVELARQLERELTAERRQYAQCAEALNRALQSAKPAIPKGYHLVCDECGSIPSDVCLAPSRCPVDRSKA